MKIRKPCILNSIIVSSTFIISLASSAANAGEFRMETGIDHMPNFGGIDLPYVKLISMSDDVEVIRGITVNRGNCKFTGTPPYPQKLKYGENIKFHLLPSCKDILESVVEAESGTYKFKFNR